MRELDKSELQEVTGGDGFIDDFFGDGILGSLINMGVDFYNDVLAGWIEGLFGSN